MQIISNTGKCSDVWKNQSDTWSYFGASYFGASWGPRVGSKQTKLMGPNLTEHVQGLIFCIMAEIYNRVHWVLPIANICRRSSSGAAARDALFATAPACRSKFRIAPHTRLLGPPRQATGPHNRYVEG